MENIQSDGDWATLLEMQESSFPIFWHRAHGRNLEHFVRDRLHEMHAVTRESVRVAIRRALRKSILVGTT